ncbi:MAG TPA: type II toxin-antitoxin system RelE/ParE family toxin [Longimicrobium sp.]|nr:type II toxin-antitoxin system RelE/ParE family toxin [Longimicrobium sp.]
MSTWSFTRKAFRDFDAIVDYIRAHATDPDRAEEVSEKIMDTCDRIGEMPLSGTRRKELRPTLRSVAVNPYTIYYRVVGERVEISRILHQRQDAARIFRKRK